MKTTKNDALGLSVGGKKKQPSLYMWRARLFFWQRKCTEKRGGKYVGGVEKDSSQEEE